MLGPGGPKEEMSDTKERFMVKFGVSMKEIAGNGTFRQNSRSIPSALT